MPEWSGMTRPLIFISRCSPPHRARRRRPKPGTRTRGGTVLDPRNCPSTPTVSSSRSLPPLLAHNSIAQSSSSRTRSREISVCILGCARSPRTGPTPDPLTRVITIPGGNGHGCLDYSGSGRSIAAAEWILESRRAHHRDAPEEIRGGNPGRKSGEEIRGGNPVSGGNPLTFRTSAFD